MPLRAVFLDVGETIVDETRQWVEWADWLRVPHFTFFATLGAVIARGEPHRRVFDLVAPGFDLARAQAERIAAGRAYAIERRDFYPDALPTLRALKAQGLIVGLAGNQPESAEAELRACGVEADVIASSAGWGVEKPSPRFFERLVEAAGVRPDEIAYVGDRLDNDVLPARRAGLLAVFLVRGPWGVLQADQAEAVLADATIRSLGELPAVLAGARG